MIDNNRLESIKQAIYKSGKYQVYFSEVDKICSNYSSEIKLPVTKNEFLTIAREFCDEPWHLVIGGRKSENPFFILYGNIYKSRNKDR